MACLVASTTEAIGLLANPPGGKADGPGSFEPPTLAGIAAAHNGVRAAVGVSTLRWNSELVALAQKMADRCYFDHSADAERTDVAGFDYVGENVYETNAARFRGTEVSDAWAIEKNNYNYANNDCNGVCDHYTQQVWRDTTDLGCAVSTCANGMHIVVCEPGDNIEDQRPY